MWVPVPSLPHWVTLGKFLNPSEFGFLMFTLKSGNHQYPVSTQFKEGP